MCIQVWFSVHTFCTETGIRLLPFPWQQMINIRFNSHINWIFAISIIIIKSCVTFNGIYCQQLRHVQVGDLAQVNEWIFHSQFATLVNDLHISINTSCEIPLDGKNPHLTQASDLTVIYIWSSCETVQHRAQGNINSLMVKYVQVWKRILSQNI